MSTTIDEFVVEIGLDPKKFNKAQREALDNFRRTQDEFAKGGDKIESSAAKSIDMVGGLRKAAIEMFAAFTGAKGVIDFTAGIVNANAAIGRMSRSTGVSVSEINRWQGAARIFGGTAEQMAGNITSLSDAFQGLKLGEISPTITLLRSISTAGGHIIDVNHGVSQSLIDLAANIETIEKKNPGEGGFLLRRLGLDPGTIDLLLSGEQTVRRVLELTDKIGVANKRDADASRALQQRIAIARLGAEAAGRSIITPGTEEAASLLTRSPNQIGLDARNQFMAEYEKHGFFGAWYNLVTGNNAIKPKPVRPIEQELGRGPFSNDAEKAKFIRDEAVRNGINPDVALAVAKSEGFSSYVGDQGSSFGSFQLHYGGIAPGGNSVPGLGDVFTKKTGLDARDRSTEREQIKFALAYAAKNGWGDWHGWRGSRFAGIGQQMPAGGSNGTSIEVTVNGGVNVQAGPNATGAEAGHAAREALVRQANASQSNSGQQ